VTLHLYFDEDSMRRSLVRALRARGVDVITALDAEMIEREDAEHLDYATEQGRVLCSFNVGDFCRLHSDYVAQGKSFGRLRTGPTPGSFLCGSSIIRLGSRCAASSS
jgi:uncharacterized protein with PIN domain